MTDDWPDNSEVIHQSVRRESATEIARLHAEIERIGNALDDVSSRIRMLGLRIEQDTSRPTKRHVRMWVTELHGISEDARKAALYNAA